MPDVVPDTHDVPDAVPEAVETTAAGNSVKTYGLWLDLLGPTLTQG